MMQLEFYQRSVVSYKQWKCLNETVAVWLQQVFIDIDAEDVVDFFAARVTSQNVASRTKKKLKKRKDGLGLCSLYLYTWISWESHKNLVRISWESRENLVRSSWDHCTLMRISWENFSLVRISWESHENSVQASISIFRVFMRKRPNMLMRISWHSHEILMRKRSNFHVKKRLTRISWETQEKSHEKLMKARKSHEKTFQFSRENENLVRFSWDLVKSSWDSHENRW